MNKILSTLGLCMRSGNLSSGDFAVSEAVRKKNAWLVILAVAGSGTAKTEVRNLGHPYQVPLYFWCDREQLGHAVGKDFRASIAVTDQGFSNAVRKQLDKESIMEV